MTEAIDHLESLGLVTRHFYGHSMVLAIDKRLEGKDAALRGFFWHGVGRAVYFSPENLVPSLGSPWPAVAMCERLAPHDVAKDNMVAGVAWGMTMVNLKQPVVLEGFLKKHGHGFGENFETDAIGVGEEDRVAAAAAGESAALRALNLRTGHADASRSQPLFPCVH